MHNRQTSHRRAFAAAALGALIGALTLWLATPHAQGQVSTGIVRVAPSGSNAAGCGSASQPCQTLQFAVEQLITGSGANRTVNGEVRVAAGTYTEGNPAFENIIGIGLPGNLTIRGGYTTSNWDTSNPANTTTLNGQGTRRGILITVPASQATACTMRIENLTIVNGRTSAIDPNGGGVLIDNCANVTLSNVTVRDSLARGVDNTNANPGTSPGSGGGVAVRGSESATAGLTLNNVTLTDNRAIGGNEASGARGGLGVGGGLFAIRSNVVANGLTVTGNLAEAGDAPSSPGNTGIQLADGLGGGIALIQLPSFQLSNITVTDNTARGGDAANLAGLGLGGGIFIELSTGQISGATISENTATGASAAGGTGGSALGGGIFATDSALTIERASVNRNTVEAGTGATNGDAGGGGISSIVGQTTSSSLNGTNLIVAANSISGSGLVLGGGIQCAGTQLSLRHATIAANTLGGGGALGGAAMSLINSGGTTCSGSVSNSIIADHPGPSTIFSGAGAGPVALNTVLSNGNTGTFVDGPNVSQTNVFAGNPRFVSPGGPNYNYRISGGSAAINQASGSNVTVDIDGQTRPVGGGTDVGADEFQIALSGSATETTIALSWQTPAGTPVASYEIRYTKEAGANDAAEGPSPISVPASENNFTLTGLTEFATYTVTVVALDAGSAVVAESVPLTLSTGQFLIYLPLVISP